MQRTRKSYAHSGRVPIGQFTNRSPFFFSHFNFSIACVVKVLRRERSIVRRSGKLKDIYIYANV